MPIGVPRIIYCWGEELPAQWTDIYNFIFRRRMVFLMQYLDDELCNQICGLLINIHMEDRSKELEKKEMDKFKPKQNRLSGTTSKESLNKNITRKSRTVEDLLNADEDLGIEEINTLEQYTLQKITTEWLNWNAQFFDYSDEPYLFYLAELLNTPKGLQHNETVSTNSYTESSTNEITQLLQMLKKSKGNVKSSINKNIDINNNVYTPFRTHVNLTPSNYNLPKKPMIHNINKYLNKKYSVNKSLNSSKPFSYKAIHKFLTDFAQKDFIEKYTNKNISSAEKALSQRYLHYDYNFAETICDDTILKENLVKFTNKNKSLNYLTQGASNKISNYMDSAIGNTENEFRNYYRKQTERTFIEEESKKVFVIINSFGGSVGNGITVHDALQFIKAGSLTLGLGVAASAASLVLAGGTIGERYVTEGCHTMIHQPECLTPDHNVLTSEGWLPITEVTLEHKVAVLAPNGTFTYQNPTKLHKYDYVGKIYKVKNQGVDLQVTPNHRMYVCKEKQDIKDQQYAFEEAINLLGKKVRYKKDGIWKKSDYQFILPSVQNKNEILQISEIKPIPLPMDIWLTFLGLWITEGTVYTTEENDKDKCYEVNIYQVKESICKILENCLTELTKIVPFKWHRNGKVYTFINQQIWSNLKSLSIGIQQKYLPSWVWELSQKQCRILLDALIAGNGHVNLEKGTRTYFTNSYQLAKDVCRLITHAGYSFAMCLEDQPSRDYEISRGESVETYNPLWRVTIITKVEPYVNDLKKQDDLTKLTIDTSNSNNKFNDALIDYNGPVYCLTVPHNVFLVMRNGIPVWTGNSSMQGQASDIWIDSQEIMKIRLDVAEIYSLSTYRPRHKILRDLDRDFYLTAMETIHYGLADEIATNEVMHSIIEETNKVWDYHDSKQQRLLESRESASSGLDTQTQN